MSKFDQWLEGPYMRRAADDEAIERIEEELWQGHRAANRYRLLAKAIEVIGDLAPSQRSEQALNRLVTQLAEDLFREGEMDEVE